MNEDDDFQSDYHIMRPSDIKKAKAPNVTLWRKIEKLVFKKGFINEALSWKGKEFINT